MKPRTGRTQRALRHAMGIQATYGITRWQQIHKSLGRNRVDSSSAQREVFLGKVHRGTNARRGP